MTAEKKSQTAGDAKTQNLSAPGHYLHLATSTGRNSFLESGTALHVARRYRLAQTGEDLDT
jgi:hypothetical protein